MTLPLARTQPRAARSQIANPPPGASPYVDASRHAHRGKYIEVREHPRAVRCASEAWTMWRPTPARVLAQVYSQNISTRYSEVHWTMHPPVALPADFVARYKGKVAPCGLQAKTAPFELGAARGSNSGPLYRSHNRPLALRNCDASTEPRSPR